MQFMVYGLGFGDRSLVRVRLNAWMEVSVTDLTCCRSY